MSDKTSEFIDHLFNAISNDPLMSAELKISLLRLQLPIHKLSQSDPSFISNPKHPARRTLFITKKLSQHIKCSNDIVKAGHILSELYNSNANANNFTAINSQLEIFAHSLQDNAAIPSGESSHYKAILNNKIKYCIQGYDIPAPCQDLILKLWPTTLFNLLKNHGEQSDQWINATSMYNELLNAIQNIESTQQYKTLKSNYIKIVRRNNHMLQTYNNKNAVEVSIKSLLAHFNHNLQHSSFMPNRVNSNPQNTQQKILSLPLNVKPGVWCEIHINDATPTRRLRLSLINTHSGTLMFVNRKGIKMLEKDAAEFTEELSQGLSRIYKHDALFTRPTTKAQLKKIG